MHVRVHPDIKAATLHSYVYCETELLRRPMIPATTQGVSTPCFSNMSCKTHHEEGMRGLMLAHLMIILPQPSADPSLSQ